MSAAHQKTQKKCCNLSNALLKPQMKTKMRTETMTLASALDTLAKTTKTEDGVFNAAIAEAADRIRELAALLVRADQALDTARIGKAAPVRANIAAALK